MKKQLLLFILPMLLLTATSQAQIKYWDFGAKDLGAGYSNMLPVGHLNAWGNQNRGIDWVDGSGSPVTNYADGVAYAPKPDDASGPYGNENGESTVSLYFKTFHSRYSNFATSNFQMSSRSSSPNPPNGTLISGGSLYTKPQLMPDLDGTTDMVFYKDSNSDRLLTVRDDITRYDGSGFDTTPLAGTDYRRLTLPDGMDVTAFPGCLQFTTPGEKRYNTSGRFRGFLVNLQANEYLTVVASGQYVDIEGNGTLGCSTGWFSFESYGGTGTPVLIEDKGTGTGAFDCSGLSGGDTGDEAPRVMEFQAVDAQTYKLAYRGGTVRFYRMFVSSTSIKSAVQAQLDASLDVDDVASTVTTDVRAVGNRVYVSNVKSSTEVKIYAITGALVKEFKTNSNTDFAFKAGLYIATVKTAEGQKSVKLLLN
ncbi:T9SS type A sorting domain-containing protein [Mariniflexile soesokkakense]|uniref:T9SS type A sorting domain-containing protein n=1 Tax=Mariniflexile soesokkakense TaxID=1343160 RepID=A0ABV0A9Z8_9FLAO